jgi:uncharacterized protein (DUF934 family)
MQLIDSRRDRWQLADSDIPNALPPLHAHLVLSLEQWRAVRELWPAALPVGVRLDNTFDVAELLADLPRLSLIALDFPKWTDGRAYSQARLLRGRHRFAGELRAIGEVLVDMMPLLQRTGFDAAVLRADQDSESARRALRFFDGHYQGDLVTPAPLFQREAA